MLRCPLVGRAAAKNAWFRLLAILAGCWLLLEEPLTQAIAQKLNPVANVDDAVRVICQVEPQGIGQQAAAEAWKTLAQASAAYLPKILAGMDNANPLATNWLVMAADAVAQRELRQGKALSADDLEKFLSETRHAPRARHLVYEWLVQVNPANRERLLPGMLNDPCPGLRRDAVARLVDQAETAKKNAQPVALGASQAVDLYRQALRASRDLDQVTLVSGRLEKLGVPVDLPRELGYILRWKLIGPFDNVGGKGFDAVYPPEKEIRFDAAYPAKHGEIRWIDHVSSAKDGLIDLQKAIVEEKGVAGYAACEFVTEQSREVQFRMASFNALKVWVNGHLVGKYHVYHGGSQPDQYICPVTLQAGRNAILVKLCQNEQTQEWARQWNFHLRVCALDGAAILSLDRENSK